MVDTQRDPAPAATELPSRGRWAGRGLAGLAGLLAAAVALGVGELIAGLVGPAGSPVVAVGNAAITLVPESLKEFAIRTFGERDKIALVTGVLVVVAIYALVVSLIALRSRRAGALGVAVLGVAGVVAATTRPSAGLLDGLPSLLGAVVGVVALLLLIAPVTGASAPAPPVVADPAAGSFANRLRAVLGSGDRTGLELDRRRFFVTGGVAL